MLETILFTTLIYLFLSRNKKLRRPRTLDGELKELIRTNYENKEIATEIRNYLLWIIENNDEEKFSDLQLSKAKEVIDRAGPAAFYWMTEIAAQLSILSAAQINGIHTGIDDELGVNATPEAVIHAVVKIS
jgi:hypothetical protein